MIGFSEKITNLKEKILGPQKIPFENGIVFSITNSPKGPELKFFKEGKEVFDLASFVPENVEIEQNEKKKWSYEYGDKDNKNKIYIGKYKGVDFFLSFLHEAGHANDQLETELFGDFLTKFYQKLMQHGSLFKYNPKFSHLYEEERQKRKRLERRAWAFTLWSIRKIERELGIKILKKMGTVEDVKNFINNFLSTLEETNKKDEEKGTSSLFKKNDLEKITKAFSD